MQKLLTILAMLAIGAWFANAYRPCRSIELNVLPGRYSSRNAHGP